MTRPIKSYDVIIAGAGPVGLFLACELKLGACSVLVLERDGDPHSSLKALPFGRRGLSIPTIENFDRRGLLDDLKALAASFDRREIPAWMQHHQRQPAGHFAGIQFFQDQVDQAAWPWRLPVPVCNLSADMASIETLLTARANALGVEIRRGISVETCEQSNDGVAVRAGSETFNAGWLVGCDGARSVVRKASGIGFTGTEPEFTGYSALVTLAAPEVLKPGRHYTAAGMYMFTPPGTINIADFDGGAFHRAAPITREHVEAVLRRVSGTDVAVSEVHLATTWTDRAFQATDYRQGRILLAGDAAHIHSPLGGQGLNLGLGDAMNLGWKLAATIQGHAPDDLLDSYQRERHPFGVQILDWSRAQVALMRPSPSSRALETIVRDLIATRDGTTYFAEKVWGVGLRIDLGDGHPLIGRSAPDFRLADGTTLNERLRTGRALFIDFTPDALFAALREQFPDLLDYIATGTDHRLGTAALLVRPDGIVSWADNAPVDAQAAGAAAACWFGTPRHSDAIHRTG